MQKDFNFIFQQKSSIIFTELNVLESILKLTIDSCFEKENNSIYYNLCNDKIIKLSNERNHYINLLSIAIEKLKIITDINETLEQEFISYSNTPTIAADK